VLGSVEEFELPASVLSNEVPWEIVVPQFALQPSGLWLPGSSPSLVSQATDLSPGVGVGAAALPSWTDQVATYITASELGYPPQTRRQLIAAVASLPFEQTMLALTHLQKELARDGLDRDAQERLVDRLLPNDTEFKRKLKAAVGIDSRAVFLSEQGLLVFQRLAMQYAAEDARATTNLDEARFVALMFTIPDAYLADVKPRDEPNSPEEGLLQQLIASGGLYDSDWVGAAIGRAHALYAVLAQTPEARAHPQFCDTAQWMETAYSTSVTELQAAGIGLAANGEMYSDEGTPGPLWTPVEVLEGTGLGLRAKPAAAALSAPRDWYQAQFAMHDNDLRYIARDFRPIFQRPFLRRADGSLLALSPRALGVALGDRGIYYRLLDLARDQGQAERRRFTNFNGWLYETYAVQAAQAAFPAPLRGITPGIQVLGDRQYRVRRGSSRTPDILILCGETDLIAIEITSSHLTARSVIEGDSTSVFRDLSKSLDKKITQLYARIDDIVENRAAIAEVNLRAVNRIWPIVVYSDSVFLSGPLWNHLERTSGPNVPRSKVQPLTLMDMPDYERFLSLSASTWPTTILERKTRPHWRHRNFGAWLTEDPDAPQSHGLPEVASRLWATAFTEASRRLFPEQFRA
jgi:hypothetical protein